MPLHWNLPALLSSLKVIKLQAQFVASHLAKLMQNIHTLQKEAGGILDIMGMFDVMRPEFSLPEGMFCFQTEWQAVEKGSFNPLLTKAFEKVPASTTRACTVIFQKCGEALVAKVNSIFTKTVKSHQGVSSLFFWTLWLVV